MDVLIALPRCVPHSSWSKTSVNRIFPRNDNARISSVGICRGLYGSNSTLRVPNFTIQRKGDPTKQQRFSIVAKGLPEEDGDHHVSILGKDVPKESFQVGSTAVAAIVLSVANKILYKMALVPLKDYPFFLAQGLTFGYVIVYASFLFFRYRSGIVTREMLDLPKKPYVAVGALEALGLATGMAAAANLPGAAIPILTQVYLVWQLLFSATILKKKYTWGQILGCLLVTAGVVVVVANGSGGDVKSLEQSGLFWPLVMIGSTAFSAGASILKEFVFRDSKERLNGRSVDIFVVNTFGSTAQALIVLLLLPILSNLKGIPFQELPNYFKQGAACFVNMGALETGCQGAPLVPLLYVAMNLAFNIASLSLLKQSSAVVSSLSVTLAVPLSIWAFTFPLPLLGAPSTLPPGLFLGAAILVAGLAFYNLSGKKAK